MLLNHPSPAPTDKTAPFEKPAPVVIPPSPAIPETEIKPELPVVLPEPPPPPEPTPSPEPPLAIEPPPPPIVIKKPKSPSEATREVLDQFLAAKTLAERLPLIETRTPEEELAKSCLAAPLAAVTSISIESTETDSAEQTVGFYYGIDFATGNNRPRPHTILVKMRGSAEPKIVVDPFLDSYGGRLAAYARAPSDQTGVFQVIIWPLAACFDERVPNREKKLTLKLLPQDNVREIALAYFDKQSKIGRMLEEDSLGYGKAKACTVILRWNVEERPETPYLEAVDFKTLDWNP